MLLDREGLLSAVYQLVPNSRKMLPTFKHSIISTGPHQRTEERAHGQPGKRHRSPHDPSTSLLR